MSATWDNGRRPGGRMELTRDRGRARVFWLPLRSIVRTLESVGKIQLTAAGLLSVMKSISPSMLKRYWKTLDSFQGRLLVECLRFRIHKFPGIELLCMTNPLRSQNEIRYQADYLT